MHADDGEAGGPDGICERVRAECDAHAVGDDAETGPCAEERAVAEADERVGEIVEGEDEPAVGAEDAAEFG